MASNSFGTLFRITTWGESHGKAIGVVIDGCPAGLPLTEEEIYRALKRRAPGTSPYTSLRKEPDLPEILSGVFENTTTGAPICIMIPNRDQKHHHYDPVQHLLRPGHGNFTYLEKYGIVDHRGGGRSSARETACRVAAGVVASKLLIKHDIRITAFLSQMGEIKIHQRDHHHESAIFCPDPQAETAMITLLEQVKQEGDSIGGVVEFLIENLPAGLGDPVYEKIEAKLASALLSLPASKGFEIGQGFGSVQLKGSEHNDSFVMRDKVETLTNHAGGVLGGITTGMPLTGKVVFKPTSSIMKPQQTLDLDYQPQVLQLPVGSRHDPCVAIRAVPVVEAMIALVLADCILLNRCAR